MDQHQALRLLALGSVLSQDPEYRLRRVFRWYSREFHTPLAEVEQAPLDQILLAWYEDQYQRLLDDPERGEDHLREECRLLTETDDERRARLAREDEDLASDDEFLKKVEEEVLEKAAPKDVEEFKARLAEDLRAPLGPKKLAPKPLPESTLPKDDPRKKVEDEVVIRFGPADFGPGDVEPLDD